MKGLTEGGREHPIMFSVLNHIRIDIRDNTFNGIAVYFMKKRSKCSSGCLSAVKVQM